MYETFTAGALRALDWARARARERGSDQVEPTDLLAALTDEPESRASVLLTEFGLEADRLRRVLGLTDAPSFNEDGLEPLPKSAELRLVLSDATIAARAIDRSVPVGTEHLLAGLIASSSPVIELLDREGLRRLELANQLDEVVVAETSPIPLAAEITPLDLGGPSEEVDLGRILDASANRAREGLRVAEDYVRFALDDPGLTRRLKEVRHRLASALLGFDPDLLIDARDTPGDVGTHIMTPSETVRENPRAVLSANFKRTAEALRSLEEYAKLIDVWLAGRFEVLRYDVYTLEKLTLTAATSRRVLNETRLYVLVGGLPTLGDLTWIVGEALAGGAQVIQLREKGLPDRELLRRAREVRILTTQAKARFVMNDRPDLARLAGADAVHLGQDDVSVRDARRIIGGHALIGVSTHNHGQLERAILDGAGYLGVGPVFPSETKDFDALAGLAFVRQAAEATTAPWFAIGGINEANLDDVLEAGASRIAVSSAVVHADRPRQAAAALRDRLDQNSE
ncbi:MAG: thiamine phosphate synthase [Isosphaeraceae bacterium]